MQDVFKEQLVKKIPTFKDNLKKYSLIGVGIILIIVLTMFFPAAMPIIFLVVGFGVFYAFSYFKIEYEYVLTNNIFDIDIIYNKSKRKKKFNCLLNNIEFMCHVNDDKFENIEQVLDFSSQVINDNTYCFLINISGKKTKIIIEPNENLLDSFAIYLTTRKLIRKK